MKYVLHCAACLVVLALTVLPSAEQLLPVPAPPTASDSAVRSSPEDFSTASLTGSHLHPDPPELIESTEEPGYVREWITVQWRPGDPIYLYVVRPTKIQKPPVVIYLYGFPSETDVFRDDDWCQRVTAGGYAAVGFVPALTGHRYHDRSVKEWFVSELQESLAKSAHDLQMVLNYLAARGDLDTDRVGMFGEGAGGTIAALAASADSRIKAVDLLNPWGDWPVWMAKSKMIPEEERATYIKPEFLQKVATFDPMAVLPKFKTPHVRLIQFNDDFPNTPLDAKKALDTALPPAAESHRFENEKEFDASVGGEAHALDWIKGHLKAGTPAAKKADYKTPAASTPRK